jgi:hypothetical protein
MAERITYIDSPGLLAKLQVNRRKMTGSFIAVPSVTMSSGNHATSQYRPVVLLTDKPHPVPNRPSLLPVTIKDHPTLLHHPDRPRQ